MKKTKRPKKTAVHIGGLEFETTIDKSGVQRLPFDPKLKTLWEAEVLDLNKLKIAYINKKISFNDYFDIMVNFGYSVCGFADLSCFEHMEIKNPLWK